jgi:hypothetical protein
MLLQLPTGRTIEMSVEDYLNLTDEDMQYIVSLGYGEEIEDPFFASVIEYGAVVTTDELPELPDVTSAKKIAEQDIEQEKE